MPGEHAHDRGSRRHPRLEQARHRGGRGGLAEHRLLLREEPVGVEDLAVRDRRDQPPDAEAAASAGSQLAGLPMRMAVATVSGSSTGWPRTIGAAPAAWNPSILGSFVLRPTRSYSV